MELHLTRNPPGREPVRPAHQLVALAGRRAGDLWPADDPARAGLGRHHPRACVGRRARRGSEPARRVLRRHPNHVRPPARPSGHRFQVSAWEALAEIPYGETRTYAEQAAVLGRPAAVRAVGAANGRNPRLDRPPLPPRRRERRRPARVRAAGSRRNGGCSSTSGRARWDGVDRAARPGGRFSGTSCRNARERREEGAAACVAGFERRVSGRQLTLDDRGVGPFRAVVTTPSESGGDRNGRTRRAASVSLRKMMSK